MSHVITMFDLLKKGPLKVTIVGGGNWGTAVGKIAAENAAESYIFDNMVRVWIYDEVVEGRSLVEVMNKDHVNSKYLPSIPIPRNLHAVANLFEACKDADLLVFVCPHQFLVDILHKLKGHIQPNAKAISLIKGCLIENDRPLLCSTLVSTVLGIDCSVMSGANVAKDVAEGQFCETTIGYRDRVSAAIWQQLFDTRYFRVNCVPDVHGVELCGALKNVIALSAGFCDGMNLGTNTKAAIIRLGVEELRVLASVFFDGIIEETFFDSSGYADVITTCWGGRNVRCAAEFVRRGRNTTWEEIEKDCLKGQKLQGHLSCKEVYGIVHNNQLDDVFPLFVATYKIAFEGAAPETLTDPFQHPDPRPVKIADECNACIVPPALLEAKKRVAARDQDGTGLRHRGTASYQEHSDTDEH